MRTLVPALLLALWLAPSPAAAFWCRGYLVLEGDRAHEVRARCGEPASVIATTEETTTFVGGRGRVDGTGVFGGTAVSRTIAVETWIYDFGPTRFMEELRFENGVLVRLTRLGYGTRRSSVETPPRSSRLAELGWLDRPRGWV
jgi:hypothetical protein